MTSPTAPSPGLGEREAVARIVERNLNQTAWPFAYRAEKATDAIIAQHIEPLRTENETLRAERDAARETNRELHRRLQAVEGPLLSRAQNAERSSVFWLNRRKHYGSEAFRQRRRAETAEAERVAAIARAEEAERGRDEARTAGILEWMKAYGKDTLADFTARTIAAETAVSDLTAKLAQAEGEIATMRERAAEVCSLRASVWRHHIGKPSETPMDEQVASLFESAAAAIRQLNLINPEHPHGD